MVFLKGCSFFKLVGCFYGVVILKVMHQVTSDFVAGHSDQGIPSVLQAGKNPLEERNE